MVGGGLEQVLFVHPVSVHSSSEKKNNFQLRCSFDMNCSAGSHQMSVVRAQHDSREGCSEMLIGQICL